MRNIITALVFAACLSLSFQASAAVPPVAPVAAVVSGGAPSIPLFVAAGMVAPLALTYAVATNVDPWHPLACALFGDSGRVGNDTDSACNH